MVSYVTSTLAAPWRLLRRRPDLARLVCREPGVADRRLADRHRAVVRRLRPDRLDDGVGRGVPHLAAAAGARRAGRGRPRRPLGPPADDDRRQPAAGRRAAAAAARRRRRADLGRLPGAGLRGGAWRRSSRRREQAMLPRVVEESDSVGAGHGQRPQRPGPEPRAAGRRRGSAASWPPSVGSRSVALADAGTFLVAALLVSRIRTSGAVRPPRRERARAVVRGRFAELPRRVGRGSPGGARPRGRSGCWRRSG